MTVAKNLIIGSFSVHPKYKADWSRTAADEFRRLRQGKGNCVKGTNTIYFIHETDIPKQRKKDVTHGSFVCTVRPEKANPNCTRFVASGDKCNFLFKVATPTAEMYLAQILFNSKVSTPGACFMTWTSPIFILRLPFMTWIHPLQDLGSTSRSHWPLQTQGQGVWTNMDTSKASWFLDFGAIKHAPSNWYFNGRWL